MTNAEKIRQMSDRQLARFLWIWKINSVSAFLANGGYGSMNAVDIGSWVDEDAEDTFVCTETYVGDDYIFDQDFNTKADRKTEPTISKMEQVPNCIDCTHYGDYEVCKGCDDDYNKFKSYYEPKDEPQTERSERWSGYQQVKDCRR